MGEVKYSKKENFVYLSEFIELMKGSISKTPKVKNHDKLKSMLPKLETMLMEKGDVEIPLQGLLNVINK